MNADIDISNTVLRTEQLILRPWRQSDLEDLYAYASVDGVGQPAGWPPHTSLEVSQRILDHFIEGKKTFAIEYRGRAVGSVGIEHGGEVPPEFADKRCRSIGYVLAKDLWGRGLMPEAVREVIRYCFEEAGLDALFCGHFLYNKQSERVQDKCGFRHYAFGTFETQLGTVEEHELRILTKEDWLRDLRKEADA